MKKLLWCIGLFGLLPMVYSMDEEQLQETVIGISYEDLPVELHFHIAKCISDDIVSGIENYQQFQKALDAYKVLVNIGLVSHYHDELVKSLHIPANFPLNISSDNALTEIDEQLAKKSRQKENVIGLKIHLLAEELRQFPDLSTIDEKVCSDDETRGFIRKGLVTLLSRELYKHPHFDKGLFSKENIEVLSTKNISPDFTIQGKPLLFYSMMLGDCVICADIRKREEELGSRKIDRAKHYIFYFCPPYRDRYHWITDVFGEEYPDYHFLNTYYEKQDAQWAERRTKGTYDIYQQSNICLLSHTEKKADQLYDGDENEKHKKRIGESFLFLQDFMKSGGTVSKVYGLTLEDEYIKDAIDALKFAINKDGVESVQEADPAS